MLTVQSVGEHSARVATIYVEIFGLPRAEVLYYILHHDSGELTAGDSPYSAKQRFPELKRGVSAAEAEGLRQLGVEMPELADWELGRFKVADLMEMWETGCHETRLGNQYADPIVRDTLIAAQEWARDKLPPYDCRMVKKWMADNNAMETT